MAKIWCVSPEPIADAPDCHYPFLLNTGRTVEHWHTRTKTGRVDILEKLAPEAWVEMNPTDAAHLELGAELQAVRSASRASMRQPPRREVT